MLVRSEGEAATGDPAVDKLYDAIGVVYHFFDDAFEERNMFRDNLAPVGIVHYDFYFPGAWFHVPFRPPGSVSSPSSRHQALICGDGWDNDPWNGGRAMATHGGLFGNFAGSLEVVAHEMAHGFVHAVCQLGLGGEPGIINEHLADGFGIMCEQFHKGQTVAEADWLIGEDLIAPAWKGVAMRSFKNPGTAYELSQKAGIRDGDDRQVAHMDQLRARAVISGGAMAAASTSTRGSQTEPST